MGVTLNIALIGGGRIAHGLIGYLAHQDDLNFQLFTRRPDDWSPEEVKCFDEKGVNIGGGKATLITNDMEKAVRGCKVILLTCAPSAYRTVLPDVIKFADEVGREGAYIGGVPAEPAFSFIGWDIIQKQNRTDLTLFATARAPFLAEVIEYGKAARIAFKKHAGFRLKVGSKPCQNVRAAASLVARIFPLKTQELTSVLGATLTPAAAVLQAARIYTACQEPKGDSIPGFYSEWDDAASEILKELGGECVELAWRLPNVQNTEVRGPMEHYTSNNAAELTRTIKGPLTVDTGERLPGKKTENGWEVDWDHQCWEDVFDNGLAVYCCMSKMILNKTPCLDKVLAWVYEHRENTCPDLLNSCGVRKFNDLVSE